MNHQAPIIRVLASFRSSLPLCSRLSLEIPLVRGKRSKQLKHAYAMRLPRGRWLWSLNRLFRSRLSLLIGGFEPTAMRAVPVVAAEPSRQFGGALFGALVGAGSPFTQACSDKARRLAVGLGGVGSGADVLEAEPLAGFGKSSGSIARAVVRHDPLDSPAQARLVGDRRLEEGNRALLTLVLHDLAEGNAGGIVNADVDKLPTRIAGTALFRASPCNAMADAAICVPVWRCRRKASTAAQAAGGGWLGNEWEREDRFRKPSTPSVRKRLTHWATVFGVTLNWRAAVTWLSPPSTTLRTIASRPFGVRGAFLWVSIRFSANRWCLATSEFPVRAEWTTS
jgi:hypothetical protein